MKLENVKEIEKNRSELTLKIEKAEFDAEVMRAYKKNVGKITVPGFRKGKAPKSIIEKMYGTGFFYDEAIDAVLPKLYSDAVEEAKLDVVSRPDIEVTTIDDNGVTISAKVYTKPTATVNKYQGLEAEKEKTVVTEEDITSEIDSVRRRNSRMLTVTDRAAENGDEAIIDFEGFVDGVAFEGGKGEKYSLKLGSGSFIPGFEEQVVGHRIGENFDISVRFPEDYGAAELAGKESVFKIVLHELKKTELPELDDEFVKEVSEKSDTVADYKKEIKAQIAERKDQVNQHAFEEKLCDALLANTDVEIPEPMIESEIDAQYRDYEYRLQSQGGNMQMYYQYTGMDEKGFRDSLKDGAERQVKTRLALEAIAKAENIKPTEEDIEAEYKKIAEGYSLELDKIKESVPVESISEDLIYRKAMDFVKEHAVVTEVSAPKAKKTAKAADEEEKPAKKTAAKKPAAKKAEKPADDKEKPAKKTASKKTEEEKQ